MIHVPHRHVSRLLTALTLIILLSIQAHAGTVQAPQELEQWQGWVSYGHEDSQCPHLYNDTYRQCTWPSTLALTIGNRSARFVTTVELFASAWVTLPGSTLHWPAEVRIRSGNQLVPVVAHKGKPSIYLDKGHHRIEGTFAWATMPKALTIPRETGILKLSINGNKINRPDRSKKGVIHLHDQQAIREVKTEDSLEIQVFRKITDSIPMLITTSIDLKVAGSPREISLGAVIPETETPVSLRSKLPVRIDAGQQIRTQLRPGHFTIILKTRINQPTTTLSLPKSQAPWPTEEIWVFEGQNRFRTVTVQDGVSIDPSQTSLPKRWHGLPAYLIRQDSPLVLEIRKRGNENPAPDNLSLKRTLWLDEAGSYYTVKDEISGTMQNSSRLEVQEVMELGRVSVDGEDQLITRRIQATQAGVEVPHGKIDLQAVSRTKAKDLNIAGWDHDFQKVQATLNLPPGWRLFATSGIDQAASWLQKWTLLDLFLVLIVVLSVSKLFGLPTAGMTLVTLTLIYHEPNAPRWIWPNLLVAIGLIRVIPPGKINKLITVYLRLSLGILILIAIPFMVEQAHWSLHPQLGHHNDYSSDIFTDDYAPVVAESRIQSPKKSYSGRGIAANLSSARQQYYQQDPSANVQTGPGLPNWHWQSMRLTWNGPIQSDQPMKLLLISPLGNRLLGLARVLCLAALILLFIRKHLTLPELDLATGKTIAALLVLGLLCVPMKVEAVQNTPDSQLLEEYETRLFSPPECLPECASIDAMSMIIKGAHLEMKLKVHAYSNTFIPLPNSTTWEPGNIVFGATPATLRRDKNGKLWIKTTEGIHTVTLSGILSSGRDISFSLPLEPHTVTFSGKGWEIDGLNQNQRPGQNIQLRKIVTKKDTVLASFEPGNLPPQLVVERNLRFDLDWSMTTTVRRLSPTGAPILVKIPLLESEAVTTGATIKDGQIQAMIPAKGSSFSWTSTLQKQSSLTLTAPKGRDWTERWQLDISPIWHIETSGLPATHNPNATSTRQPTYHPWPGETLELQITRPAAIPGETFTIDHSKLLVEPGKRATESTLTLQARSSKGGQHTVTLPEESSLKSVKIDGREEPIRMQGNQIMIPIHPGHQVIELNWNQPQTIGLMYTVAQTSLGVASVNSDIEIKVPRNRWVLFTGGPQTGPAILFWAEFLVILLVSLALGRVPFTPLKSWQWMLLAGGLSQAGLVPTAFVLIWILALGARNKYGTGLKGAIFNIQQCGLILLTLLAALSLFYAVHNGLLGRPQMQIEGNGSSSFILRWYQDRFIELPRPWFISAPILVFRLSMLAWALWLAFSVLGWLRWGWDCFATEGLWKEVKKIQLRKKPSSPPSS